MLKKNRVCEAAKTREANGVRVVDASFLLDPPLHLCLPWAYASRSSSNTWVVYSCVSQLVGRSPEVSRAGVLTWLLQFLFFFFEGLKCSYQRRKYALLIFLQDTYFNIIIYGPDMIEGGILFCFEWNKFRLPLYDATGVQHPLEKGPQPQSSFLTLALSKDKTTFSGPKTQNSKQSKYNNWENKTSYLESY